MNTEEYDMFGLIKPKPKEVPKDRMSFDHKHRIHQTKDIFESNCSLCQADQRKRIKTYWSDGE